MKRYRLIIITALWHRNPVALSCIYPPLYIYIFYTFSTTTSSPFSFSFNYVCNTCFPISVLFRFPPPFLFLTVNISASFLFLALRRRMNAIFFFLNSGSDCAIFLKKKKITNKRVRHYLPDWSSL